MKIVKLLFAMLLAISVVTPFQLKVEAAGTNIRNATKINLNSTVSDSITQSGEVDFYKFYIGTSGTVGFDFESEADDFYFEIFDYNAESIYDSQFTYDNVKGINEGSMTLRLTAGTYYVAIGDEYKYNNSAKGTYFFSTYFVNANETTTEYYESNNNTIKLASKVDVNKEYRGQISLGDEVDFYKFYLADSGKVFLSTEMNFRVNDIVIYDESGNKAWYSTYNEWNETTKTCIKDYDLYLNAGTYYLAISRYQYGYSKKAEYYGTYKFKLNYKKTNEKVKEYNSGNNNTYNTASTINITPEYQTFYGQIAVGDDADFYKFYAPKKSDFHLVVDAIFSSASLYIYDQNGNQIHSDTYNSINSTTKLATMEYKAVLEAGVYYFCVKSQYDNKMGTYSVKASLAPPFNDLLAARYDWYFSCISEAYYKGLVSGTSVNMFEPNKNMTRGMVANVLYRMAGSPSVTFRKKFADVNNGLWYSSAITWCSNAGVVNGYSNGKFGPDDPITREQMAAMCYNYARYRIGRKPSATTSLVKYKDDQNVTRNMQEAMRWAVASGIISGTKDGYLKPTAKATRAECTKMLLQLSKIVK